MKNCYNPCFLCPRDCGAYRSYLKKHTIGYCGETASLRIACASIHKGEEPPITAIDKIGENSKGGGSGTIFVSGCNLGCIFCQNYQISSHTAPAILGRTVETAEFAEICLQLQKKGAENINIVTGSHAVPAIIEGIASAKAVGLNIPILWNSSAYELPETLEMLEETVDVFLPDLKTLDSSISTRFFNAPDYPAIATRAIKKMLEMRSLRFAQDREKIVSGVMIRHLVLPGFLPASREVLCWYKDHCAGKALLSLMFQFTPLDLTSVSDRYISRSEYETVLGWLNELGIEDGYCQELVPGNIDWLPDFEKENPFPSDLSIPVWHWKTGFIH